MDVVAVAVDSVAAEGSQGAAFQSNQIRPDTVHLQRRRERQNAL